MITIDKIMFDKDIIFIHYNIQDQTRIITSMSIPILTLDTNYKSKYSYLENMSIVSFILFCLNDFRHSKEEFLKELSRIEIEYLDSSILMKYKENILNIERHTESVSNIIKCKCTLIFDGSDRI